MERYVKMFFFYTEYHSGRMNLRVERTYLKSRCHLHATAPMPQQHILLGKTKLDL